MKIKESNLPCPWCGEEPRLYESGQVSCSNNACISKNSRMTPEEWNSRDIEPKYEDPRIIVSRDKNNKVHKVSWLNMDECYDSDVDAVNYQIDDYMFEPGMWFVEIKVIYEKDTEGWNSTEETDARLDFIKEIRLIF